MNARWTSPSVILTIISLLMAALGSYLAIQRSGDQELGAIRERVRAVEVRVDGLEHRESR